MFSLFNGIYDSYLAPSQLNILVVGGTNSGKSALLERLKVTEIPTRTKGNDNTAQTAKEMTQTLYTAFVETGAVDIAGRRKSSIVRITDSDTKTKCTPEDINRQLAVAEEAYSSQTKIPPSQPVATAPSKRRFRFNICPAPERYLKSAQDQDEEFEAAEHEEEQKKLLASVDRERSRSPLSLEEEDNAAFSEPPRRVRCHSKEFNVESLDLMDGRTSSLQDIPLSGSLGKCGVPGSNSNDPQKRSSRRSTTQMQPAIQGSALLQSSTAEYNVKANAKMLPLVKIRPTIGTNLGKLDMYGAKCHIFDVGGRLQDLWERYYEDCDAVIFCWKLGQDPDKPQKDDGDESDDENDYPQSTYSTQLKMLNSVRKSIPDDVPFLVFGHIFGNANEKVVDKMYSTDLLLPHYHNPNTILCCGSAKTGAGVQSAMEWLVPLAKRQQKERLSARKQLEEKAV